MKKLILCVAILCFTDIKEINKDNEIIGYILNPSRYNESL